MGYPLQTTPFFERQLKKLKAKAKFLFERLTKKLKEILANPLHYKSLGNELKGKRRAHLDPFVVIFEIQQDTVVVHYVKHHDDAY